MAKVFIEETTLTKIGNAIRGKTGKTALIDPAVMDVEITNIPAGGGGSDEVPTVELTGDCSYTCTGVLAGTFMELFPNKVTSRNVTSATYMFYNTPLARLPLAVNFKTGANVDCSSMFRNCYNLTSIPDLEFSTSGTSYYNKLEGLFYNCYELETLPKIKNCRAGTISDLFNNCRAVTQIPDDYFSTFDNSYINSTTSAYMQRVFNGCYKLRKIPSSFLTFVANAKVSGASSSCYSSMVGNCYSLDELVDLPVLPNTYTSNCFSGMTSGCYRLKRLTFKLNDDGTPKPASWKSQTIDLSGTVGYCVSTSTFVNNTNFTFDTCVNNETDYQALKDNPDYWSAQAEYSRYDHDSALETINTLPDTSAYLATAGGTNTIKFKATAATRTDAGGPSALTAEEIAIAAAKGWTVSIS